MKCAMASENGAPAYSCNLWSFLFRLPIPTKYISKDNQKHKKLQEFHDVINDAIRYKKEIAVES